MRGGRVMCGAERGPSFKLGRQNGYRSSKLRLTSHATMLLANLGSMMRVLCFRQCATGFDLICLFAECNLERNALTDAQSMER